MAKQIQKSQQTQEQELEIPSELISKFDNDEQLVREFIAEGYSISELQSSTITHPTRYDPMVVLGDHTLGFWIDSPKEEKYMDNSRLYKNRTNRFF
jgi:hypothetical protein